MEIRKTKAEDLPEVMAIYARARRFMAQTGNPNQWGDSRPGEELIRQDIAQGVSYVCADEESGRIEATFMFDIREDPTYARIEDGSWPNSEPYGVLHRIASAGRQGGIAPQCIRWCFARCGNLRCDTHEENRVMQHVLEKAGFVRCGRIYVEDGSPRIAYQKTE